MRLKRGPVGAVSRAAHSISLLLAVSLAAAAFIAFGSACGSGGDSGSTPSLEGTSWRLTDWSDGSQDPADFTITAEFADGRIGGTSAVNTYGGLYEAGSDGAFSIGEIASTMMAGPEPDMRAETTYLELLAGASSYKVDDGSLTLSDADGNASLIYAVASFSD